MNVQSNVSRYSEGFDLPVRGDTITADRYISREYMELENKNLWPRVWHLGGMVAELEEEGDFVRHNIGKESVIMVRQADGSIKAFYNTCPHRGNRLILGDVGGGERITCGYHNWQFSPDGVLVKAQDPDDFPGGDPCGKVKLSEILCDTWGPFVFYCMDLDAKPLLEWLSPLPERLKGYGLGNWVRVMNLSADANFNWKIIRDNFNESYHLPTIHPELATFINDGLPDTLFEMYETGHNSMWMKGHQATTRNEALQTGEVPSPLDDIARAWGVDPAPFKGHTGDIRQAIIEAKRRLGPGRGYKNYVDMSDQQLVDYFHCTFFPNLTLTMSPEQCQILRTEPHPTDPEKCVFQHWILVPPVEGMKEVDSPIGKLPLAWAENRHSVYGDGQSLGFVADQDLSIGTSQQQGLNSRGFKGCMLTYQEKRIQRFHELLDDYVHGIV
ncbi:aromatic ring-hydroxylating oxygenase subunit alpha [Aquisediminimonas sediminicola]|uniref:aromatic ring-hydroxylating oxygenase subunit alpha n=1 Tax=Alteraquisediminimonas sediminicola TaxID=2676787 RepID=UPI001C8E0473|nr:aromatic ring-hydroxylating dioxygenase subunit alpha [Aquisediminimonas sediminicola]